MKRLKILRNEKNLLQKDVANAINVGRTTYVKYENGDSEPSMKILVQLANFFEVSTDYLLGKTNEKNKPADSGEPLKENMVIFHRDGKTVKKEFSPEQMELIAKLLNEIPGETKEN